RPDHTGSPSAIRPERARATHSVRSTTARSWQRAGMHKAKESTWRRLRVSWPGLLDHHNARANGVASRRTVGRGDGSVTRVSLERDPEELDAAPQGLFLQDIG